MDSLKQTALNRTILPCIQQIQTTEKFIYVPHILAKSNQANKGKVFPVTATDAGGGRRIMPPLILKFGFRLR
jgi:hypothetical protein